MENSNEKTHDKNKPVIELDKAVDSAAIQAQARRVKTMRAIRRTKIAIIVVFIISAGLAIYVYAQSIPPPVGTYDAFAQCIANTSTTFYGAWWCPHCAAQKTEFGDAAKYLPYVECANPDQSENQTCIDKGIQHFPTWYFPDGSSSTGVNSLANLSKETGCALPSHS